MPSLVEQVIVEVHLFPPGDVADLAERVRRTISRLTMQDDDSIQTRAAGSVLRFQVQYHWIEDVRTVLAEMSIDEKERVVMTIVNEAPIRTLPKLYRGRLCVGEDLFR